jgi:hypothetical protein
MRSRGQGLVAIAIVVAVVVGGLALERAVGVRHLPSTPAPGLASGSWICPHGGGKGWSAFLFIANPGSEPVLARITPLGRRGAAPPQDLEVPAGSTVRVEVPAEGPDAATFVERFGAWVGVGWVTVSGAEPQPGAGAEPCAPGGGRTWYLADGAADQGQSTDLTVANPFGVDAVVDVVLVAKDRAPIRDTALTSVVVRAGRSRAIPLSRFVAGERAVGAIVQARVGRVAIAGTVRVRGAGYRQLLGQAATWSEPIVPMIGGTGQAELEIVRAAGSPTPFDATVISSSGARPAGDLVEQVVDPTSAQTFPVVAEGPVAVHVAAPGGATLAASLRAAGPNDVGAIGWARPAKAWLVLPTVAGEPSRPGLVVVNPGGEPATVTMRVLGPDGPGAEATIEVGAGSAASAPASLRDAGADAALLVASDVPVVAAGGSTSLGNVGASAFALALGIPVP